MAFATISTLAVSNIAEARSHMQHEQCPTQSGLMPELTEEQRAEIREIMMTHEESVQSIHRDHAMKRAEYQALMLNDNPDPEYAAELTGEILDLQTAMNEAVEQLATQLEEGYDLPKFAIMSRMSPMHNNPHGAMSPMHGEMHRPMHGEVDRPTHGEMQRPMHGEMNRPMSRS